MCGCVGASVWHIPAGNLIHSCVCNASCVCVSCLGLTEAECFRHERQPNVEGKPKHLGSDLGSATSQYVTLV